MPKRCKYGVIKSGTRKGLCRRQEKDKIVKIESHGSGYSMRNGELIYYPMLKKGELAKEWGVVEEAPMSFKGGHERALRELGVPTEKRNKIIKRISYY